MKLIFIIAFLSSAFLWTLPIAHSYIRLWNWSIKLLTHVGAYGSGSQGIIDAYAYLLNWYHLFINYWFFVLLAVGTLLFSLIQIIKKNTTRKIFFLLAVALCVLIQFAFIAKHYDEHYLLPTLGLFSSIFVLLFVGIKSEKTILKIVVFALIAIFTVQSLTCAIKYRTRLNDVTKNILDFNAMIHSKYPNSIYVGGIEAMPSRNSEFALFWGNDRNPGEQEELLRLYPNNLSYFCNNIDDPETVYGFGIYNFKEKLWADDLIKSNSRIIFMAPTDYNFSETPYTVKLLEKGKYSSAYLLIDSTERQANDLFQKALKLSQEKDYKQAFVYAFKSKDLHYQPQDKVDYLLYLIYRSLRN